MLGKLQIVNEIELYQLKQLHSKHLSIVRSEDRELYLLAEWFGIKIQQYGGTYEDAMSLCTKLGEMSNFDNMYYVASTMLEQYKIENSCQELLIN